MNVPQRNRITRGLLSTIVRIVIRIEKKIECSDGSAITKKTKLDFGFSNIHIFFIFYRIFFPYLIFSFEVIGHALFHQRQKMKKILV